MGISLAIQIRSFSFSCFSCLLLGVIGACVSEPSAPGSQVKLRLRTESIVRNGGTISYIYTALWEFFLGVVISPYYDLCWGETIASLVNRISEPSTEIYQNGLLCHFDWSMKSRLYKPCGRHSRLEVPPRVNTVAITPSNSSFSRQLCFLRMYSSFSGFTVPPGGILL